MRKFALVIALVLAFPLAASASQPSWYRSLTTSGSQVETASQELARCPSFTGLKLAGKACASGRASAIAAGLSDIATRSEAAESRHLCVSHLKAIDAVALRGMKRALAFATSQPPVVADNIDARTAIVVNVGNFLHQELALTRCINAV